MSKKCIDEDRNNAEVQSKDVISVYLLLNNSFHLFSMSFHIHTCNILFLFTFSKCLNFVVARPLYVEQ